MAAVPVNILISTIALFVALHYQHGGRGLAWFAANSAINIVRFVQCLQIPRLLKDSPARARQRLDQLCLTALLSGIVWSFILFLCDGYTNQQSAFYLTITCGITAGAITHGTPYARMPTSYILPPLLSIFCCLILTGKFEKLCLALTVLIYAAALIRFARQGEAEFRKTNLLKNQAVTLARSLEKAHARALAVAEDMRYRATHDGLTDLLNRTGFMNEMRNLIKSRKSLFCLMLLNLDNFKSINDVFGHAAGDKVLEEVARRLAETLDPAFTIARLNGDEFAIFYDTAIARLPASELAARLLASIAEPFPFFDAGRIGACIGLYMGQERNATEFLTYADQALYAAKAQGRNHLHIFNDVLREKLSMQRDVERDLRLALEQGTPEVWYQPIVAGDGRKLVSFEALLRWKHPQHGMVPPPEVIAIATKTGLAEALLRQILTNVCMMIQALQARNLTDIRVAMNLSPREISQFAVDDILLAELRRQNCPVSMLEVEITEETVLDIPSVQEKLLRLARSGVQITVDDFGVGYSSLASLRQPYVKRLKIDKSFVKDIALSQGNQILVQSILNLGRSLDLQVVAEGVETLEDLAFLQHAGCDLMQGYYFQSPAPLAAILATLPTHPR
ncbi:putative bifunctional diguanylate cyclase/phosphodiesterase [Acidocella sp.]|uniref:putative bifunctional diguanylate cyclase/phosphodiesterase n=1 Tax=Acidocella sp. TaxID=50710 RepID=UPI003D07AAA0